MCEWGDGRHWFTNLNTGRIVSLTMRPVILSTLPHFLTLWFLFPFEGAAIQLYATLVAVSSCASVAWHWSREPYGSLFWLDYGLATAWTVADLVIAAYISGGGPPLFITVAYLNGLTIAANKLSDWMAEKKWVSYDVGHTAWHCLSWSKCWLVAYLLIIQG